MPRSKEIRAAVYHRAAHEPVTALYCRSAIQDSVAIEKQKNRLACYSEENGYTNISWYIDDGESGLTLDRPAMKRLIDDIHSGEIKTVIVTKSDRIARGMDAMCEWIMLLKGLDVQCTSVFTGKDGLSNEFAFWLQSFRYVYPEIYAAEKRRDSNRLNH